MATFSFLCGIFFNDFTFDCTCPFHLIIFLTTIMIGGTYDTETVFFTCFFNSYICYICLAKDWNLVATGLVSDVLAVHSGVTSVRA